MSKKGNIAYYTNILTEVMPVIPQFYDPELRSVFCLADFNEETGEMDLIRIPVDHISRNPNRFDKKTGKSRQARSLHFHFKKGFPEPPELEKVQEVPGLDRIKNIMKRK